MGYQLTMGNIDYVERIVPGTKAFEVNFGPHIARYNFAKDIILGRKLRGKLLDVACGSGYGTAHLADYLSLDLVGVDIDKSAIDFAAKNYQRRGLNFKLMDALNLTFKSGEFSYVVSFEILEHVTSPEKFLKEIRRVLKKDGFLMISTPNKALASPAGRIKNPFHIKEFTKEEFERILRKYFKRVTIFGQYFNQYYYERQQIMALVRQLMIERNSFYLNIFRGIFPNVIRKSVPRFLRKSVGENIYNMGKKRFAQQNDLLDRMELIYSQSDTSIDKFHIDQAFVLVALCH